MRVQFVLLLIAVAAAMEPLVAPARGEHKGTWIFLHGLGDTGNGWFGELKAIQRENPHIRIVCPTAPVAPVTLNGGMSMTSWHDLVSLNSISDQHFRGIDSTTTTGKKPPHTFTAILDSLKFLFFSHGSPE